ncbi:hypothetical protein CANARDRAFT_24130 [[Candida] arabinofermentans NRRL YB-2248]|uniref:Arrestin-like N-terminal domain-containing protein n=1 Tax=[Candida] arabinofermentans NRRL YB-2248 TaxID=983967 RepID=A0A1E4SXY3_9ASCO|nr:hypothetical protein CANARDRAFT_24130 [[Candida] arabinofermentans NRRL YB-2248]
MVLFSFHHDKPISIYSPQNPIVKGTLDLKFEKSLDKIKSIDITFSGSATTTYVYVYYTTHMVLINGRMQQRRRRVEEKIVEVHPFFTQKAALIESFDMDAKLKEFAAGEHLKYPIEFRFPSDSVFLPSSVSGYGSSLDNCGYLTVKYMMNVHISRDKKIFSKAIDHEIVLPYQCGNNVIPAEPQKVILAASHVYKSNLKQYIYDPTDDRMIPNPLNESHRHTRGIRKLWNKNYKEENYKELTKDVPITLSLETFNYFDLNFKINQLGSLKFISKGFSDIEPDFRFLKQSTKLGCFKISSISFVLKSDVMVRSRQYTYDGKGPMVQLLSRSYPTGTEPEIDIAYFEKNSEGSAFQTTLPLDALITNVETVLQSLKSPIMPTVMLGDYFHTTLTLNCSVKIKNLAGSEADLKMETPVVIANNHYHVSNQRNQFDFVPVKPFNMNQQQQQTATKSTPYMPATVAENRAAAPPPYGSVIVDEFSNLSVSSPPASSDRRLSSNSTSSYTETRNESVSQVLSPVAPPVISTTPVSSGFKFPSAYR